MCAWDGGPNRIQKLTLIFWQTYLVNYAHKFSEGTYIENNSPQDKLKEEKNSRMN